MDKHLVAILALGFGLSLSPASNLARNHISGSKAIARLRSGQSQDSNNFPGRTGTLLPDGRLLLVGGEGPDGPVTTVAIQDLQTGAVVELSSRLQRARAWHTATLLPDGTVLVLGGIGRAHETVDTPELFDPIAGKIETLSPSGLTARAYHTATLLTEGRVLIAGGIDSKGEVLGKLELWDYRAHSILSVSADLRSPRSKHTATLLANGTVLLWGGVDANGLVLNYGEIFDPRLQSVRLETSPAPSTGSDQPPQIEESIPSDGSKDVPTSVVVALRFSKPLNVTSVNASTTILSDSQNAVDAVVVPAEGGMLAFITPKAALASGTTYSLSLIGVGDAKGRQLDDTQIFFTTTGNPPDTGNEGGLVGVVGPSGGESRPFDSPWRKLPPLKAPLGVTALAGQALKLDGTPLEGVTLKIDNQSAKTDGTGRFLLPNISAGHHAMVIDGRTATKRQEVYGVYEAGVDAVGGQTTALTYTIWMTQIDTAHAVTLSVPTAGEVVVTTPFIPGLEFHIPTGTTITDIDGNVANQVSITQIPIAQPPFPLPPGVNVPVYFTIQPGGGYIWVQHSGSPQGGWLVYPNSFHLPAGSIFDFWNYNADDSGWFVYGHGKVSSDAKSIVPDPGLFIYELTGAMVGGSGLAPSSGPSNPCQWWNQFCGGEPVDLGSGLFVYDTSDLYLTDAIPIDLRRTYRPNDAASRAFGVGTSHSYDVFLVGDSSTYSYIDVISPAGGRIHCPRISPGTSYAGAVFQCNSTPGEYMGATTTWNGAGWTLTRRDGIALQFHDGFAAQRAQQGALLSITDRNGNTLAINRDSNFNITDIISPNGRWIQFTYDANYRITQAQDNIGRTVQYSYDSGGRLNQVIDANGGTWKYNYDSNNNMTSLIDARNITYLQNQYDSQNRVTKQTLADGVSTYQFSYNPSPCTSNCSGIWETDATDPNGYVKKVYFNSAPIFSNGFTTGGSGSTVTYAAGTSVAQTFAFQYQPGTNLMTSTIDPLNRTTSYTYDPLGNVTTITRLAGTPNAITTSMTYEAKFNQVTSVTDPLNHASSFGYDTNGNLISFTDPLGNAWAFGYNAAGQIVSAADPLGETWTFAYDGADLTAITDPLGRTATFLNDSVGRIVSRTDALGAAMRYTYNSLDEVTQVFDRNGGITSLGYDANRNLISFTDARNGANSTTYTYDNFDRLATRKDPLGNQESYQYDGNDNLTQFTDRRGKIALFSYDGLNRRTFAGFGKSGSTYESTIGYTFDAVNRPIQVVDSVSGTITRGYDGLNRLTSEAAPQGTVSYSYDNGGRRTSLTVAGQSAVNYTFDSGNRLTQITQGTATVSLTYDAAGRKATLTLPNGIAVGYGYDNGSELASLTYAYGSIMLGNLSYGYDLDGRRVTTTGSYARTGLPVPLSPASYNVDNELTIWGATNYLYDSNGNIISDGAHSYTWDARNHLTSIDNGTTASFTYDPFGRRVSKNVLGTSTSFLYDGMNVVQEVIGGTNTANSLTGGIDEEFQRTDSAGARSFLRDSLGNTIALADSEGTLQTQYTFDPFGGTTVTGSSTGNSFAYTGRELDGTGLYFYRGRYYNPTLTRFLSQDPVEYAAGPNIYSYVSNDPINFADPFGLDKKPPAGKQPPWCSSCKNSGGGGGDGGGGMPPGPNPPSQKPGPRTNNPGNPKTWGPQASQGTCGLIAGMQGFKAAWELGRAGAAVAGEEVPELGGPANGISVNPFSPEGVVDTGLELVTNCGAYE